MSASDTWANACQQRLSAANLRALALNLDRITLAISLCEFLVSNSRVSGGCADLP